MKTRMFLGEDYCNPDGFCNYHLDVYDNSLAMAISVGGKPNCHSYTDLCEDSLGYVVTDSFRIGMVADAHYGVKAASATIKQIADQAEMLEEVLRVEFSAKRLKEWALDVLYPFSLQLYSEVKDKPLRQQSRTQFSMVIMKDDHVIWLSIGDTRIYTTFKRNSSYAINKPASASTIGYPNSFNEFFQKLQTGEFKFQDKDSNAIIICSDGFPEVNKPDMEIEPELLIDWLGDFNTSERAVRNFMQEAINREACDNLSAIVMMK